MVGIGWWVLDSGHQMVGIEWWALNCGHIMTQLNPVRIFY